MDVTGLDGVQVGRSADKPDIEFRDGRLVFVTDGLPRLVHAALKDLSVVGRLVNLTGGATTSSDPATVNPRAPIAIEEVGSLLFESGAPSRSGPRLTRSSNLRLTLNQKRTVRRCWRLAFMRCFAVCRAYGPAPTTIVRNFLTGWRSVRQARCIRNRPANAGAAPAFSRSTLAGTVVSPTFERSRSTPITPTFSGLKMWAISRMSMAWSDRSRFYSKILVMTQTHIVSRHFLTR